jgi:predicted DsbA family dithiol-disulfide isomerase
MEGLVYAAQKISRQPNTLDCHRLILWSRSATDPGRMKQRLMELYFAEGADLSDPKVLIQAAVDCGMDGDLVRRLLASDADVDRIEGEANAPRKPASTACPASSSAAASSSPARSRRNISPARFSAGRL